MSVRRPRRRK